MSSLRRMVALHDLCWNFIFSHQMICKQHIVLNHVFFKYKGNLKIQTRYIRSTKINVNYCPPTKLQEGNVFSRICQSIIFSTGFPSRDSQCSPCTGTPQGLVLAPWSSECIWDLTVHRASRVPALENPTVLTSGGY